MTLRNKDQHLLHCQEIIYNDEVCFVILKEREMEGYNYSEFVLYNNSYNKQEIKETCYYELLI